MRDIMIKDNCHNVEVIGWLYQFYISEKKDALPEAKKFALQKEKLSLLKEV